MSFGENFKKLRLRANLTQEEVADKLIIARQTISKWERDVSLPPLDLIVPITKILKCTIEEIFIIYE